MSQINPQEVVDKGILIPAIGAECKVQQVGIDLTIQEGLVLQHGQSKNVLLNEIVNLPADVFATFIQRSTFNRKGVIILGSIYDPGYNGQIGCTVYNLSGEELYIEPGERIGQMVFYKAESASSYNGKYQGEHLK